MIRQPQWQRAKPIRIDRKAAWLLLALLSSPLHGQVVSGTNTGPIPDGGLPGVTGPNNFGPPRDVLFNVSGRTGTVETLTVGFEATHSFVGDLRVTLISPLGIPHILFSRTGATAAGEFGSGADLVANESYVFNDSATTNWWSHVASNPNTIPGVGARTTIEGGAGVTAPATATSLDETFRASPPNGVWTLRFEDGAAQDTGMVASAQLFLVTQGGNREVTTDADSGPGSLRQALLDSNPADLISFASPFFDTPRNIELQTQLPTIDKTLAIAGPGADKLTVRRADDAGEMAIFRIFGAGGVSISGLRINNALRSSSIGGGVFSDSPLALSGVHVVGNRASNGAGLGLANSGATVVNSTISANQASSSSPRSAGAIYFQGAPGGRIRLIGTTVSGNRSNGGAGGILNLANNELNDTGQVELISSTVVNNAGSAGGGIVSATVGIATASRVTLRNSLVARNFPNNFLADAQSGSAVIDSLGFNLSDDYSGISSNQASDVSGDPRLGPLALYAGSVPTHTLLGGSPALDAGNGSAGAPLTAARGEDRVFDDAAIGNAAGGNGADIGAVEMRTVLVSNASDAGAGSLRAALEAANANGPGLDDILFASPFFDQARTINLASALPVIGSALTVVGPGANLLTVRPSSAANFRILDVPGGLSRVAFAGLTLRDGRFDTGTAIFSSSNITLSHMHLLDNNALPNDGAGMQLQFANGRIDNTTISGNIGQAAGGILFFANAGQRLEIENSTIAGNTGGGLVFAPLESQSSVQIKSSTIAGNTGNGVLLVPQSAGISVLLMLRNSIVADNTAGNFGNSAQGAGPAEILSRGYNLSDTASASFLDQPSDQNSANPGLAPLALAGGSVPVMALELGSDALDGGNAEGGSSLSDQRGMGFARTVDLSLPNMPGSDGTDIGAFEAQSISMPDTIFDDGFEG